MSKLLKILLSFYFLFIMAGCGQDGPLYPPPPKLPQEAQDMNI